MTVRAKVKEVKVFQMSVLRLFVNVYLFVVYVESISRLPQIILQSLKKL